MIFRARRPQPPLDRFIEMMIYFEGVVHKHSIDRFLPNGDTEIIIDFHDAPQFIYDNNSLKEIESHRRVWTSGIRTEPITIPSGNGSALLVITFKKGMAAAFFPFPMEEMTDTVLDAELVWGPDFGDLRDHLLDIADIDERFSTVEAFLLQKFGRSLEPNACIEFAVRTMSERPDKLSIAKMNKQIGYSQKHFTDLFRRHVGVTPKSFLKIMRFQKAVSTIDEVSEVDWGAIALDCGFYDQSHFIHDFRAFSGFTPEQYAKVHTHYQNYVPVG